MMIIKRHHSPRGLPLAYHHPIRDKSVLSIELVETWADLFLIDPCGFVSRVSNQQTKVYANQVNIDIGNVWSDNAFNPRHFDALAEFLGAIPCPISRQIVMGRWILAGHPARAPERLEGTRRRHAHAKWFTSDRRMVDCRTG